MKHLLTVDLTTRGRVWLEAHDYVLPDPFTHEDVIAGIKLMYPGGAVRFMRESLYAVPRVTRVRAGQ